MRNNEAAGRDVFSMWHAKDPAKIYSTTMKGLDERYFVPIGKAHEILYHSDKWEKKGDHFPYEHRFTSHPLVYLPQSQVADEDRVGRPIKTLSLLGLRAQPSELYVAFLATVRNFVLRDRSGELVELKLGNSPKLFSTLDKKALIIGVKNGPVIVRGGQMRVTERGIER